jgi:hypothetical protein
MIDKAVTCRRGYAASSDGIGSVMMWHAANEDASLVVPLLGRRWGGSGSGAYAARRRDSNYVKIINNTRG